jgi:hypothetical protein
VGNLATSEIQELLQRLGERYPHPATLYLLGGGALCFLGNPRRTVDIDYTLDVSGREEAQSAQLEAVIAALADEMHLELEAIPIDEFVPLPEGAHARHRFIG